MVVRTHRRRLSRLSPRLAGPADAAALPTTRWRLRMKWRPDLRSAPAGVLLAIAGLILVARATHAEEGAGGHYLPGATADFIDMLPGQPGFAYANLPLYYHGSVGGSRSLEFGGLVASNVTATIWGDTSLLLYETPWRILGGEYAAAIAIPYLSVDVKGSVKAGPLDKSMSSSASGIGDIELFPAMLVWKEGDLKWGGNFGIYAPTGGFAVGSLANTGKNFWTFEPGVNFSYLSTKNGLELTGFAAVDINTSNDATAYQSGAQFHLDLTAAQHLPLWGGIAGIGANFFYYQQVSGDSGSGAKLGSFEGMTVGIGPVLSYVYPLGKANLAAEAKWLPELDTNNRLKGDIAWLKLAVNMPF